MLVDADCLVAGTLTATGATTDLIDLWEDGGIELVVCPRLVNEVSKTLLLPRLAGKYGINVSDVERLARRLMVSTANKSPHWWPAEFPAR